MADRRAAQAAYAEDELARLVADVAATGSGLRNRALNAAALALGHFVGAGALASERVERALTAAAVRAGLRQGEAASTIRSGLAAGTREPAFGREREPSGVRVQALPPAAPAGGDVDHGYQALARSLVELCPMGGDVAAYLRSRGLPVDASPDLFALPAAPEQPVLLAELTARHGRDAVMTSGLTDRDGRSIQWSGHRLGMIWRDAITGAVASVQRRFLGNPAEDVPKTVFARGLNVPWPWGAHLLRGVPQSEPIAIVEGVLDWIAWRQLYPEGAPCIALPSATVLRHEWIDDLIGRQVFVALDSDAVGEKAATEILEQLSRCARPLRIRPWPDCKDWADRCDPSYRAAPDEDIERAAIQREVAA